MHRRKLKTMKDWEREANGNCQYSWYDYAKPGAWWMKAYSYILWMSQHQEYTEMDTCRWVRHTAE